MSDCVVDAGLLLLEKAFQNIGNGCSIIGVQKCRLMMSGEESMDRNKFIAIMPR